jgi:hypothetical protein
MSGGDYRDELTAAHARIAELEQEVSDLKGSGGNAAAPWLGELRAKRAAAIAEGMRGLGDPKRRWKVRGIIVATAMILATLVALITGSWVPFIPFGIFTLHPGMLLVFVIGKSREQKMKREVAKIDEKIADVRRMAQMMGAARVRVDGGPRVAASPDEIEAEAAEDAKRARG